MAKTAMKMKQARPAKFSTREYNRCKICGRPHAYLRKYGICRIHPIEIDGRPTAPARVRKAAFNGVETALEVTIHDGRNRQVRRLCEREGLHLRKLTRVAEGSLLLGDLDEGHWRKLSEKEIRKLKENM